MSTSDLRLWAAVALGKVTAQASRLLGLGGGTTMPGRVARGVAPDALQSLTARLRLGTIVVTGTNGKTTTSRLISHILAQSGVRSVHNRAGANLAAGIVAALVEQAAWDGAPQGDLGLFEVDEATLPLVEPALRPRIVVLTNLFRDQLDRYGEIDLIAGRWQAALSAAGERAQIIFNADDPLVTDVATRAPGPRIAYGIDDDTCGLGTLEHAADARYCYRCGRPYTYDTVHFGHMGVYRCGQCGASRPTPVVSAGNVELHGIEGSAFDLTWAGRRHRVRTPLPGIYNIHNILAAAATCLTMDVPLEVVAAAVGTFAPAFGRAERMRVDGREVVLLLAKNPAGFNEVLRTVAADPGGQVVLIAINDLTADGRDISWLWDVDFEMLAATERPIIVSGIRAADMLLRLKYAGVSESTRRLIPDLGTALDASLDAAGNGARLYVLPTYTAMLHLRKILHQRGYVKGFWQD